jgi:hypothetical protein
MAGRADMDFTPRPTEPLGVGEIYLSFHRKVVAVYEDVPVDDSYFQDLKTQSLSPAGAARRSG